MTPIAEGVALETLSDGYSKGSKALPTTVFLNRTLDELIANVGQSYE
jgi:hypothetical protein